MLIPTPYSVGWYSQDYYYLFIWLPATDKQRLRVCTPVPPLHKWVVSSLYTGFVTNIETSKGAGSGCTWRPDCTRTFMHVCTFGLDELLTADDGNTVLLHRVVGIASARGTYAVADAAIRSPLSPYHHRFCPFCLRVFTNPAFRNAFATRILFLITTIGLFL